MSVAGPGHCTADVRLKRSTRICARTRAENGIDFEKFMSMIGGLLTRIESMREPVVSSELAGRMRNAGVERRPAGIGRAFVDAGVRARVARHAVRAEGAGVEPAALGVVVEIHVADDVDVVRHLDRGARPDVGHDGRLPAAREMTHPRRCGFRTGASATSR